MSALLTRGIGLTASLIDTVGGALSIVGQGSLSGTLGAAFSFFPIVGGGDLPYTFDLAVGALPDGLSLDANTGEISGTPTAVGTASGVVLRVTDDAGATATLPPFEIVVTSGVAVSPPTLDAEYDLPVINAPQNTGLVLTGPLSAAVFSSEPVVWTITTPTTGYSIDADTGEVTVDTDVAAYVQGGSLSLTATNTGGPLEVILSVTVGSYGVLLALSNNVADSGSNYVRNGTSMLGAAGVSVNPNYATDAGSRFADAGAIVARNTGSPDVNLLIPIDISGLVDGQLYEFRLSTRNNWINASAGSYSQRVQWLDGAQAPIGDLIPEMPGFGASSGDELIFDGEFSAVKPVGAQFIGVEAHRTSGDPWSGNAFLFHTLYIKGPGGVGDWPFVPALLGGDLGVIQTVTVGYEQLDFAAPVRIIQTGDGTLNVPVGAELLPKPIAPTAGRDGIMLDPTYKKDVTGQALDDRLPKWDQSNELTLPHVFAENDVVITATSRDEYGGRAGTIDRQVNLFCTATPVDPDIPTPGLVRDHDDVANLPALNIRAPVDWSAKLAELPTYAVTSVGGPSLAAALSSYWSSDIGLNLMREASNGYQEAMRFGTGGPDAGSNYGFELAKSHQNILSIFDSSYTTPDRLIGFKACALYGVQMLDSGFQTDQQQPLDGGHIQGHQPNAMLGLHAIGQVQSGELLDHFLDRYFGNYGQAFQITQDMLDNEFQPHSRAYNNVSPGPQAWFMRQITDIGGPNGNRIYIRGNGEGQIKFNGLPVICPATGNESIASNQLQENINNTDPTHFEVPQGDQALFSIGDFIHFDWINKTPPAAGSYHWAIRGRIDDFSPSKTTGYVIKQQWIAGYLIAKMCGFNDPRMDAFFGYVEQSLTDPALVYPNIGSGATPYLQDWRAQHEAAIRAL